jgi:hypothetical protein
VKRFYELKADGVVGVPAVYVRSSLVPDFSCVFLIISVSLSISCSFLLLCVL